MKPQLLTVAEAAELINVKPDVIKGWIKGDLIPYIAIPSKRFGIFPSKRYLIPLHGFQVVLSELYDLAADIDGLLKIAEDRKKNK